MDVDVGSSMQVPMPELVSDREVATAGAASRLNGIDEDPTLRWEQQTGQSAAGSKGGHAGESQQISVLLDVETVVFLRKVQRIDWRHGQIVKAGGFEQGSGGRFWTHAGQIRTSVCDS
jgi:hypothetical protein